MKKTIWIKNFVSRENADNIKSVFTDIKEVDSITVDYDARTVVLKTSEVFSDAKIRELFKRANSTYEILKIE
ncbi:MAG: hypothetical protein RR191_03955 [Cetobacterium sp.]|uniref:hypothetical protein n=1 Tax=unclassified Cetobacterium TaxID=2630983 RepID=UPI00163C9BD5|nr:hypothetical protein [Cetobacterium sp. 2A]MBC2856064.1 hypothetical protein [Cetobacterium sp. 2A]